MDSSQQAAPAVDPNAQPDQNNVQAPNAAPQDPNSQPQVPSDAANAPAAEQAPEGNQPPPPPPLPTPDPDLVFAPVFANPDSGKFNGRALGTMLYGAGPPQLLWVDSREIDAVAPYTNSKGNQFSSIHLKSGVNVLAAIAAELLMKRLEWL